MDTVANDEFIPCEFCDTQVRFSDYEAHCAECQSAYRGGFIARLLHMSQLPVHRGRGMFYGPDDDADVDADVDADADADADGDADADDGDALVGEGPDVVHATSDVALRLGVVPGGTFEAFRIHFGGGASTIQHIIGGGGDDDYEFNLMLGDIIGNESNGLQDPSSVLERVEEFNAGEICPICMDELRTETAVRTIACRHLFCEPCITQWLRQHNKCPVCIGELLQTPQHTTTPMDDTEERADGLTD